MAQQLLRTPVRREGSGPAPRAPAPGRVRAEGTAGTGVRARRERPRRHLAAAVACARCQAINPHPERYCEECGALLKDSPLVRPAEAAREAEREALGELRRAFRTLAGVTWMHRLGALAYAAVAAVAVFALQREDVPRGAGLLVVALTTLMSGVMLAGALQVVFKPFVWTLVVAGLATLVAAVHLIGPNPLDLAFWWSAGWATAFWASAWPALRIRRLIAEHTDLYVEHQASRRTRRSLERCTPEARHARLMAAMRRAFQGSWKTSGLAGGALCAASAFGSYLVLTNLRPEEFSTVLERFQGAWNRGDLDAVAGLYPPELGPQESAVLVRLVDGHGWRSAPPLLDAGLVRSDGQRKRVDYELDGVRVATTWMVRGQRWLLTGVELPTPPLGPTFERFLAAWRASDTDAVAAFYPADYVERMATSIEYSARRRGWSRLPKILGTVESDPSERRAVVTLRLDRDEVVSEWLFRKDGSWHLQDLEFPLAKRP